MEIRTDVSSVQAEALIHRQSEHVLGEKEETSFSFFSSTNNLTAAADVKQCFIVTEPSVVILNDLQA